MLFAIKHLNFGFLFNPDGLIYEENGDTVSTLHNKVVTVRRFWKGSHSEAVKLLDVVGRRFNDLVLILELCLVFIDDALRLHCFVNNSLKFK